MANVPNQPLLLEKWRPPSGCLEEPDRESYAGQTPSTVPDPR